MQRAEVKKWASLHRACAAVLDGAFACVLARSDGSCRSTHKCQRPPVTLPHLCLPTVVARIRELAFFRGATPPPERAVEGDGRLITASAEPRYYEMAAAERPRVLRAPARPVVSSAHHFVLLVLFLFFSPSRFTSSVFLSSGRSRHRMRFRGRAPLLCGTCSARNARRGSQE